MSSDPTLGERVGYLYRRLLLLQRLFQVPDGSDHAEWLGTGEKDTDLALCAGIREVLEELTEHARILTTVPSPLMDWRLGDGPDDERWRALTEVERRELLSILNAYEKLIAWGDRVTRPGIEPADELEPGGGGAAVRSRQVLRDLHEAPEYLCAERARIVRFREEMGFLEAGPKGSPTVDQMIADVKDGVLVEGAGSFSIDQQRYNGQFGGDAFWEIKNGKKTRMVTNFTYNAITTDFWANLDAVGPPETWEHHGLSGDAKGSRSNRIIRRTDRLRA